MADRAWPGPPLRCAVWGTGHMGRTLTRAAVRRGDVLPVAAVVSTPAKAGRDLGEIVGLDAPLGVVATLDGDAVLARDDVDVVIHCGTGTKEEIVDVLRRAARAGKDAITFCAIAHPATALGDDAARELDAHARSAGRRILGGGFAPGFALDVLPVVIASASVEWTAITARMVMRMDSWGEDVLDAWGIGLPPGSHRDPSTRLSFLECAGTIVEALGVDVASSEQAYEPIAAERRITGRRTVEPGMARGALRRSRVTTSAGRTVTVDLHALFGLDEELDGVGDEVVIDVDGPPDSTLHARLTGGWAADPYPATAACGLNALPGLRSLPPGLYDAAHVPFAVRRDGDFRGVAR